MLGSTYKCEYDCRVATGDYSLDEATARFAARHERIAKVTVELMFCLVELSENPAGFAAAVGAVGQHSQALAAYRLNACYATPWSSIRNYLRAKSLSWSPVMKMRWTH